MTMELRDPSSLSLLCRNTAVLQFFVSTMQQNISAMLVLCLYYAAIAASSPPPPAVTPPTLPITRYFWRFDFYW